MPSRRPDGERGVLARVRWGNLARLAAVLGAGLLIAVGPKGCRGAAAGGGPALPPDTAVAPPGEAGAGTAGAGGAGGEARAGKAGAGGEAGRGPAGEGAPRGGRARGQREAQRRREAKRRRAERRRTERRRRKTRRQARGRRTNAPTAPNPLPQPENPLQDPSPRA